AVPGHAVPATVVPVGSVYFAPNFYACSSGHADGGHAERRRRRTVVAAAVDPLAQLVRDDALETEVLEGGREAVDRAPRAVFAGSGVAAVADGLADGEPFVVQMSAAACAIMADSRPRLRNSQRQTSPASPLAPTTKEIAT